MYFAKKNNGYDVAIIGNGVLAYSIAYILSKLDQTLKICIIGPFSKIGSATTSAGAMLGCFSEHTASLSKNQYGQEKVNLGLIAKKKWPSWLEEIRLESNEKIEIDGDTYLILNSHSGHLDIENFYAIHNLLQREKEPFTEINPLDIPGINPRENNWPLRALHIPGEGYLNTNALLGAFEKIFDNTPNITLIDDSVESLKLQGNEVSSLITTSGTQVSFAKVVLAAGAYTQHFIDQIPDLRYRIPRIMCGAGYAAIVDQDPDNIISDVIRTPNRAGACGLHSLPYGKDKIYIGATNNIHFTPQTTPSLGLLTFLTTCAIEQINHNFYKTKFHSFLVGNRPASLDTFPLIGKSSLNNLWIMTGTYRDGFFMSPYFAEEIAKDIIFNKSSLPNLFKPERALIKTNTVKESIDEFVHHYICGGYEHKMRLPNFIDEDNFKNMVREKVLVMTEKLGIDFGLAPDMILFFEFTPEKEKMFKFFREYFKENTSAHTKSHF